MSRSGSEPAWMEIAAYAVHTAACTYVLDRAGVCHWVLGPNGGAASTMDRCIGAQFVACLDPNEPGLLVGELRIGATALFACHDGERFVLLRSPAISWVEQRDAAVTSPADERTPFLARPIGYETDPRARSADVERAETTEVLGPEFTSPAPSRLPPPMPPPRRYDAFRPETAAIARTFEHVDDGSMPVEDIASYTEVTLTMPLYRSSDPPPPPASHREAFSRGQRLR